MAYHKCLLQQLFCSISRSFNNLREISLTRRSMEFKKQLQRSAQQARGISVRHVQTQSIWRTLFGSAVIYAACQCRLILDSKQF